MDIVQEMLTTFNDAPDLFKKHVTNLGCMAMTMKPKPYHPQEIRPKKARKACKFEGFAHYFLRLQIRGA